MTQVVGKIPENQILSERKYEAVPVKNESSDALVDPEDSIATTKEEEWVTKKKIELTTTRQIETRVKRQVVLEDGKVVEDSGPMVTTNTTEDTEKQEHSQTEHRTLGDDNAGENWVSVANPSGCVKEVQEKTVKSREETEERTETENIQHLGDFSDEGYMTAVKSGSDDFRLALEVSNKKELVESGPKIIHQSLKTKKLIDTEDKTERSQVQPGGKIINETRTTRLHEEYGDCNVSDDESSNSASLYETSKKENSQRYRRTKEQDLTEYIANGQKIGEKLHHQAETTEGERRGDFFDFDELDSLPSKLKRMRLRSQNSRLALENSSEQKDILSKKPSSYDQEEETRKAETSKWLEYHFGSESTKSSKGSVEDLDDIVPSTQNSFISVTMKSQPLKKTSKPKYVSPSEESRIIPERVIKNVSSDNESYITTTGRDGYFQGISQWSSKKEEKADYLNKTRNQSSGYNERPYSPAHFNPQRHRTYLNSTPLSKTGIDDRGSPALEPIRRFTPISQTRSDASLSPHSKIVTNEFRENQSRSPSSLQFASYDNNRPSPPLRKKQREGGGQVERTFEARTRKEVQKVNGPSFEGGDSLNDAPYRSSTPKVEDSATFSLPANKKLYQRTRFAADIPPPPQPKPEPVKPKSKIGESFKKFVGKLRSSSQDRKNKKRSKSNDSRSPSPRENTYQNYNSLDNYGSLVDRGAEEIEEPLAPPRKFNGNLQPRPLGKGDRGLQRYYLGEDPFSASIYGREREYEENSDRIVKSRRTESDTDGEVDFKSRTLGRFSKSTSRLLNPEVQSQSYSYDRRGAQTLPRKFRDEKIDEKPEISKNFQEPHRMPPVSTRTPNRWKFNKVGTREPLSHTGSMINVSIVNQPYTPSVTTDTVKRPGISLNGPAKPARTYRSNLSRSQSFNVQPGDRSFNSYKSNPQLHRLEEAPAPLESPSIISNWSQSSKTLNEDRLKLPDTKDKRRLFMKGLYDRAPELFKTLHGDNLDEIQNFKEERNPANYSNSFRSTSTVNTNSSIDASSPHYYRFKRDNYKSPTFTETYYDDNVIKTVSRSESSGNDDYSETVRIKSKSDDPLNPSETDTVKTFTKKKIPLKNGLATETIESSETKTIQKSQNLRGGFESDRSFYNRSPSGVVIKVRNGRN